MSLLSKAKSAVKSVASKASSAVKSAVSSVKSAVSSKPSSSSSSSSKPSTASKVVSTVKSVVSPSKPATSSSSSSKSSSSSSSKPSVASSVKSAVQKVASSPTVQKIASAVKATSSNPVSKAIATAVKSQSSAPSVSSQLSALKSKVSPVVQKVASTAQKVASSPIVQKTAGILEKTSLNPAVKVLAGAITKPSTPAVSQQLAANKAAVPPQSIKINPGDTLSKIAAANGVSVAELAKANNIADPNKIQAGANLVIPKKQEGPVQPQNQPVQPTVEQPQEQYAPEQEASPIQSQQQALQDSVTPPSDQAPANPPVNQPSVPQAPQESQLAKQLAALQEMSPEEKKLQDQQVALEKSYLEGQQNVGEQPVAMSFISGQQASLENRFNNAQIPLQQKLANAQARRQASMDSVKFQLEREDKAQERLDRLNAPKEGFTLSEGETRYDAQGNRIAYGGAKTSASGGSSSGGVGLSSLAKAVQDGTISLDKLTPTQRGQVAAELSQAGVKPGSANFSETSQNTLAAVNELLKDESALARITGPIDQLVGGVFGKAALAKNQYKQLKGLLSLENIKYLKGTGAISDAEQRLLSEAASTIGRNLPTNLLVQELKKLKTGLEALKQKGAAVSGGSGGGDPLGIR